MNPRPDSPEGTEALAEAMALAQKLLAEGKLTAAQLQGISEGTHEVAEVSQTEAARRETLARFEGILEESDRLKRQRLFLKPGVTPPKSTLDHNLIARNAFKDGVIPRKVEEHKFGHPLVVEVWFDNDGIIGYFPAELFTAEPPTAE